jgi:DEAD/DEAH box helicase
MDEPISPSSRTNKDKVSKKKKITLSLKSNAGWTTTDVSTPSIEQFEPVISAPAPVNRPPKNRPPPRGQHHRAQKSGELWSDVNDNAFDLKMEPEKTSSAESLARPGFRKPKDKKSRDRKPKQERTGALQNDTRQSSSHESNTYSEERPSVDQMARYNLYHTSSKSTLRGSSNLYSADAVSFASFSNRLNPLIVSTLMNDMKFTSMTPVQSQTITPLLDNRDCHIQAKTGTGKTVSFLVPSIQKIISIPRKNGISLLVITPTRELAMQIATEARQITMHIKNVKVGISIGGTNINTEKNAIMNGLDILIATPGRLLDHLRDANIASMVYNLDTFVLDECDRLLDMGFSPDIFKILKFLPSERQTVLCSATVTPRVTDVASKLLKRDHFFVSTVPKGEVDTHKKVPQVYVVAPFTEQLLNVISLLEAEKSLTLKAIVFLPTAHLANLYYGVYSESSPHNTYVQHSRQSQSKRQNVSDKFKDCTNGIMFATVTKS